MVFLSCDDVAVGFAFFTYRSSATILAEYMPLYMKQLGFSAVFIGLVPILGLLTQTMGTPLIGFVADKFRARKLFLLVVLLLTIPITLLFLAPRTPQPSCETSTTRYLSGENGTMAPSTFLRNSNSTNAMPAAKFSENRSSTIQRNEVTRPRARLLNQTIMDDNDKSKDRLELFLIFLSLRGIFELLKRLTFTFLTVAAMTHVKNDKTKFGFYCCWGEVGTGIWLFVVSILIFYTQEMLCGEQVPNYFVTFLCTAGLQCLTLVSLPWLKYEYLERRVVNFDEVKKILLDPHHLLLLLIYAHGGACSSFQMRWEFWYMEQLGGSVLVIAVGGLVRHPIIALWFLLSRSVINRLGEINVVAIALFLFSTSFAALAFIANPWLVVVFDSFQAVAYALFYPSVILHFSKVTSKSSSAVIQAIVVTTFSTGKDVGTALTGWLFTSKGTTITLCCYSIVTALYLAICMVYIFTAKDLHDAYMEIPSEDKTGDE